MSTIKSTQCHSAGSQEIATLRVVTRRVTSSSLETSTKLSRSPNSGSAPRNDNRRIKFACIEYSTKSGEIWRKKPSRPNYLCDPQKEIDPTSFGCWTSALSGEHIPISYLRTGKNSGSLNFKIRRSVDLLQEKINQKPIYHNLEYIKKFNLILVLVHSFSMPLMAELLPRLKKINPKALYLGSIGSPLGKLREVWKKNREFIAFKKFADHCDLFVNVNRAAQKYLEYITKSKVIYFPQFYPYEFARKFYKSRDQKGNSILVSGDSSRTDNLAGQYVAIQIQKKYPEILIKIVNFPGLNVAPLKMAKARFKIIPFTPWQKHLERLSRFLIVINLDNIWTLGRLQADCAAVGTPSVGLNSNNQMEMFPDLSTLDLQGINQAVILSERLIIDQEFYQRVCEQAKNKARESSYQNSKQRLKEIITDHDN